MARRIIVALTIGCVTAGLYWWHFFYSTLPGGDIAWPLCGAQALLQGQDPYAACPAFFGRWFPTNPLTTIITVLPLTPFSPRLGATIFTGISAAVLAFGLTRENQWWRLLVFISLPYYQSLEMVQWAPLLTAVALFPALLPLTLAKPQVGLPIALAHLTWRRALACGLFLLGTLILDPMWPLRWLPHTQHYADLAILPLLILPVGPFLLLALLRWRDPRARLFMIMASMPQRIFYDQLVLWLIPSTWREMVILTISSWVVLLLGAHLGLTSPVWSVVCLYLPPLVFLIRPQIAHAIEQIKKTPHNGVGSVAEQNEAEQLGQHVT